jgi:hypothetical protein
VDCSSSDGGHLFIASLTVAKIRHANVARVKTTSGFECVDNEALRDLHMQSTLKEKSNVER